MNDERRLGPGLARRRWRRRAVPASYTIGRRGATYYGWPGAGGGVRYSGTSFNQVAQQICDALPSGGAIHITRGVHVADATILPRSNQWLVGEGPATVITRNADVPIVRFAECKARPAHQHHNALLNLSLDGGGTAADLVQAWNLKLSHFEKITLGNFAGNGFYMSGDGMKSIYNQFRDVELDRPADGNRGSLFHLTKDTSDSYINGVQGCGNNTGIVGITAAGTGGYTIQNFHVDRLKTTLIVDSTTGGVEAIFFLDSFIDTTQEHGIVLKAVNHGILSCIIANNYVISPCLGTPDIYDAIHLDAGAQWINDVLIQGNRGKFEARPSYRYAYHQVMPTGGGYARIRYIGNGLYPGASGLYKNIPAWSSTISEDTVFVGKRTRAGIGTGAQQAIPHGCGDTPDPTQVFLSERDTGGARAYQSTPPDGTCIYVTARRGKTYNWRVEL